MFYFFFFLGEMNCQTPFELFLEVFSVFVIGADVKLSLL